MMFVQVGIAILGLWAVAATAVTVWLWLRYCASDRSRWAWKASSDSWKDQAGEWFDEYKKFRDKYMALRSDVQRARDVLGRESGEDA